ncbi:MAG TPA: DUF1819 domain-containing protein [Armatimonadetes bacterium]|nr:DUF1819 domain-containing protein [Armatimonadota bacterium]
MSEPSRAEQISSFTIIKGSLIDETYTAFCHWDLAQDSKANLDRIQAEDPIGASSANWLRDIVRVLSRRFDPTGRDRPLVLLAQAGLDRQRWAPLLLWHMTRDEFLVRDFFTRWLYTQYTAGTYRLHVEEVVAYVQDAVRSRPGAAQPWRPVTTARVAQGLLRMAVDFGLLRGTVAREFTRYRLPDESFLYLLYALYERTGNTRRTIAAEDWRLFLMDESDVERELFRLHQMHWLDYQVAGSLAQLSLPLASAAEYAAEMVQ